MKLLYFSPEGGRSIHQLLPDCLNESLPPRIQ
jgi:hypothetical protein